MYMGLPGTNHDVYGPYEAQIMQVEIKAWPIALIVNFDGAKIEIAHNRSPVTEPGVARQWQARTG
jgi:hypothetical protein